MYRSRGSGLEAIGYTLMIFGSCGTVLILLKRDVNSTTAYLYSHFIAKLI